MTFPTVKSSPWKKGIRRRLANRLWPGAFWKKLVDRAWADHYGNPAMSPACVEMIGDQNLTLYGYR